VVNQTFNFGRKVDETASRRERRQVAAGHFANRTRRLKAIRALLRASRCDMAALS
jgi:hypothetical protein